MTETKGLQKPLPPSPKTDQGVKTWINKLLGKEKRPHPYDLRPNFNFEASERAGSLEHDAQPTALAVAEAPPQDDIRKGRKSFQMPRRATYSSDAGATRNEPQMRIDRSSSTGGSEHCEAAIYDSNCIHGNPKASHSRARSDSGQHLTVSPPRRRTATSVEPVDGKMTWISQKAEMERVIHGQAAALAQNDAEIRALRLENDTIDKRAEEWERMYLEAKREAHNAVVDQSRTQLAQVEEMQRRCWELERELEQTKVLLDVRTVELSAAQAFMTTADQYSVADVSRAVDQLNDEFFQCAMDISDALLRHREPGTPSSGTRERGWRSRVQESRRLITKRWDEDTLVRLEADIAQDDTVMFECMVQSVFMSEARNIIRSFCLENGDVDKHMSRLWKAISASQETSIAKNWLAITISTSNNQATHDDSRLMRYLYALLVVAGWREPLDSKVLERIVRGRLTDMTAKAERIRDMIFKGILSVHTEVFDYEGGREFDPATMQDAYEVPERQASPSKEGQVKVTANGPIVCSTGLGLRCVMKSSRSSSSGSRRQVVLKPKVLLCSTLSGPTDDKSTDTTHDIY